MAWIESHQALEKHPKMYDLMSLTGWTLDEAIGKLHRFWWWCVDYAEDGDLRKHNDARIGAAVGLNGEQANLFVKAMVEACWLDRKPYFRVHDWWDYIGKFLQIKYKNNPEKYHRIKKLYETKNNGSKGGCKGGSKTHNQPTNLNQPNQPTLTNQEALPDWVPKEAWDGFVEMRKKGKGVFTDRAKNLAISELEKLRSQGQDPGAVLNQSVMNGWKGLFPIKQGASHGSTQRHSQDARTPTGGVKPTPGKYDNTAIKIDLDEDSGDDP